MLPILQIHHQPLLLECQGARLHERRDRQHVVHDAAVQPLRPLVELDVEAQRILDPARQRRPRMRQPRYFARGEHHLARDVETHHLGRQLGAQHDVQRLGIAPGVELRVAGRVSLGGDVADHRDVASDLGAHQLGILSQRERQARHRTQGHEGDRVRLLGQEPVERLHEVEDHPCWRQLRVPQAGLAVRLRGHRERSLERSPGAHAERGPLPSAAHDRDGVPERVLHERVSVGDGDAPHVELRRLQRQEQRQRVVDAGVGIDQNGMREAGGGRRRLWHG